MQISVLPLASKPKMYRVPMVHGPLSTAVWVTFGTQSAPSHGDPDAFPAGANAATINPQPATATAMLIGYQIQTTASLPPTHLTASTDMPLLRWIPKPVPHCMVYT